MSLLAVAIADLGTFSSFVRMARFALSHITIRYLLQTCVDISIKQLVRFKYLNSKWVRTFRVKQILRVVIIVLLLLVFAGRRKAGGGKRR